MKENFEPNQYISLLEEKIDFYQNKVESFYKDQFRIINNERLKIEEAKSSLEEKYTELYDKYAILIHESSEYKVSYNKASELLQANGVRLACLQKELDAARAAHEETLEKYASAGKELGSLKAALSEAAAHAASEEREHVAERTRLQSALESSQQAVAEALEKLDSAVKERDSLKAALSEAAAHAASEDREHVAERTRLQSTLESSRQALAEALEKLDSIVKERDRLKTALSETTAHAASEEQSYVAECTRLQATVQKMRKSLDRMIPVEQYNQLRNELVHQQEEHNLSSRRNAQTIDELQSKISRMENWTSMKVGRAVIKAGSLKGFLSLPYDLYHVWKDVRGRRGAEGKALSIQSLRQMLMTQGGKAVLQQITESSLSPGRKADLAARLAKECYKQDSTSALLLMECSLSYKNNNTYRKWYAFRLFDAGNIRKSYALLAELGKTVHFSASENNKKRYIEGCERLLNKLPVIHEISRKKSDNNRKIFYIASSSIVYQTTGYTVRTHNLLRELVAQGMEVLCVTRPGYPLDRNDIQFDGEIRRSCEIDNVTYITLDGPHRRKEALDVYLTKSSDLLTEFFRKVQPAVVHAASNYETALPACMAAHSLGIPFIYEVRGLWEYTTASRIPQWETSERFHLDSRLEAYVTAHADAVCALNGSLLEEIMRRATLRRAPFLLPNAIPGDLRPVTEKSETFLNRWSLSKNDFIVGYVGSIVGYEGLDILLRAASDIKEEIPSLKVVLCGVGNALDSLKELSAELGMEKRVIFTGAVPHKDVALCMSVFDVAVLPRADYAVCHLVSPLKLYEYMAYGLPLVVSDVKAMREMVDPGSDALVFPVGNTRALSECLIRLHAHPELRRSLREHALETASRHTWAKSVGKLLKCYSSFFSEEYADVSHAEKGGFMQPGLSESDSQIAEICRGDEHITPLAENITVLPCTGNSLTAEEKDLLQDRLKSSLAGGGAAAVMDFLKRQDAVCSRKIQAFCHIKASGLLLAAGFDEQAVVCAEHAAVLDSGAGTLRGFIKVLHDAARFEKAAEVATRLKTQLGAKISEKDASFLARIFESEALLRDAVAEKSACRFEPRPGVVLNILAFSLPYTSVGYATRSHGLARGIQHAGWDIVPYTRPGFPGDFKKELAGETLPLTDTIDGVTYHRILDISRNDMSEEAYLRACAEAWETIILQVRPSVVHAASNYVTALPALIAAKKTGVSFVYEVRGFWEVTRSSRDKSFMNTAKYRYMALFEKVVCDQADKVITITTPMKKELMHRGLPEEKISIAFNSVDVERFVPVPRDEALAEKLSIAGDCPVIGYVGSIVDYEGLDDLITAAAALKQEGLKFRLLLVGDGAVFEELHRQVEELSLEDIVIMPGRVPHEQVESYYSLVHIAPFPRKPWEVCELVSPLKPFEAMAQQKAVVVSSTEALREIVRHGENGMIFEKGNVVSLQNVLRELLTDADLCARLGQNARNWVMQERTWNHAGQVCVETYGKL